MKAHVFLPAILVALLIMSSCQSKKDQPTPTTLGGQSYVYVYPLPDGGAYAAGYEGGLWLLRGTEAVKVKEVEQFSLQPTKGHAMSKAEKFLWAQNEAARTRQLVDQHKTNKEEEQASEPQDY